MNLTKFIGSLQGESNRAGSDLGPVYVELPKPASLTQQIETTGESQTKLKILGFTLFTAFAMSVAATGVASAEEKWKKGSTQE